MALLRRRSPLSNLEERLEDIWPGFSKLSRGNGGESLRRWSPRVDIFEKDSDIVVECDLPGLNKEDIDVSIEGDMLTISGERREEKEVEGEGRNYYRSERLYDVFERSFSLPSSVDREHVDAQYENGVLTVTMPKTEEAKKKSISVK